MQIKKYRPLTSSQEYLAYVVLNLLAASLVLVPFFVFWGGTMQWQDLGVPDVRFVFLVVASVYMHEGLHALGLRVFGKAPSDSIRIVLDWKKVKFKTCCSVPVTARSFRWMALLPAIVLAVIPACLSWIYGNGWMAAWSVLMFNGATFDFMSVWEVRDLGCDDLVILESQVADRTTAYTPS